MQRGAEATLRSERDTFEEVMECHKDDLSQVHITHDKVEAREKKAIADCRYTLKVFKFKKYKEEYENGKRVGVSKVLA